jgi:hypothetical protein
VFTEIRTKMRLVVSSALVVIVGLIAGDIIGVILGAGSYRGAIPGAVVAVSVFVWRRREEGGSLKAIKTARQAPLEAHPLTANGCLARASTVAGNESSPLSVKAPPLKAGG